MEKIEGLTRIYSTNSNRYITVERSINEVMNLVTVYNDYNWSGPQYLIDRDNSLEMAKALIEPYANDNYYLGEAFNLIATELAGEKEKVQARIDTIEFLGYDGDYYSLDEARQKSVDTIIELRKELKNGE